MGEKKDSGFNGEFATWAVVGADNKVTQVSFTLPLSVVRTIPDTIQADDLRIPVKMPQIAIDQTIFRAVAYNYRPRGHTPAGIYDTPHWEWHPSIVTNEVMEAVDCTDTTPTQSGTLPPGYIMIPNGPCTKAMGYHAFNTAAPEFNGQRFNSSPHGLAFYKGVFLSFEPKITRDWFLRQQQGTYAVPQVTTLGLPAGLLYPQTFNVSYNSQFDTYVLTYSDFIVKQ